MFPGNKKSMLVTALMAVFAAAAPYALDSDSRLEDMSEIDRLESKSSALEQALLTQQQAQAEEEQLPEIHIAWDQLLNVRALYTSLAIETAEPAAETPVAAWWGVAVGSAPEILAFARRADRNPHAQIHDFSYAQGRAALTFFVIGREQML